MNKLRLSFLVILSVCVLLLSSCEQDCRHENTSESKIAPSCTESGETVYTCDDCGYSYKANIIEPKGHSFEKNTVAPTCTEDGYTEYTCECGYSYISDYVSAKGHEYKDTVIYPDCESGGHTTHECNNCDYSFTSNHTNPTAHEYNKTVHAPTCEDQGYTVYVCKICGNEYVSDYTAPTEHNIVSNVTSPTCEDEGYTTFSCESCEFSYISEYTKPKGHKISTKTTSPTCTTEGKTVYSCDNCDYTYAEIIRALGHDLSRLVTMPTLSDAGYTEYTCNRDGCGHTLTSDLRFYSDILPNGAYANNSTALAKGIDVSSYNYGSYESIDFQAIKAEGIDYVIIKAGSSYRDNFSVGGIDPKFEKSYAEAKAAGLDVGVYFYTYATNVNEIIQDARLLLSILDGKQFEYPIYLDLEDPSLESIDKATVTEMCVEFFTILQRAGYYTGLYVNDNWLKNHLDTETALERFEIWYARPSTEWNVEKFGENLGMWQYSFEGTFESMEGVPFDLDYAYKNYPEIIKNGGFNGYNADEIKFIDSEKEFVYVSANAINVRSSFDFDSDSNIIGFGYFGDCFEIVEKAEGYIKIIFNGQYAYITANTEYISFEYPIK